MRNYLVRMIDGKNAKSIEVAAKSERQAAARAENQNRGWMAIWATPITR